MSFIVTRIWGVFWGRGRERVRGWIFFFSHLRSSHILHFSVWFFLMSKCVFSKSITLHSVFAAASGLSSSSLKIIIDFEEKVHIFYFPL